ncbi:substrate-binding periplasmic protein [Limimonas halophila]|uniref:substrate-binding periplasmic protein n=1 Tax=Limimonas halophila TaxID=1082479 RepID=UPI000B7FB36A|nr:transporter substrate-binding domain-containing protein [Limimonas halophila]
MLRCTRLARRGALLGSALLGLGLTAAAQPVPAQSGPPDARPDVTVATLTWPPYTKRSLPKGGAVTAVVRAAFDAVGRDVRVRYRPWNRAIALAKAESTGVVAYYPGYHCNHRPDAGFLRSYVIGMRPLGLAKRANAAFSWTSLADLEGFRIGTVVGYANTRTFDRKVAAEELWTIESHSDRRNLHKLIEGRLDYAVIDKHVMTYLLNTDPELRPHRDEVVMDDTLLGRMPLFVCFRNSPRGKALRSAFNDGLTQVPYKDIMAGRIARLSAKGAE